MKGLEDMTSHLEVLLETSPKLGDCSRHSLEKARLERWVSVSHARQVCGDAGRKGGFTLKKKKKTLCQLRTKDDFMWYQAKDKKHKSIRRKTTGTSIHDAFSGDKSKTKDIYDGRTTDSCMVFMAETPPLGHRENFLDAVIMANNAPKR